LDNRNTTLTSIATGVEKGQELKQEHRVKGTKAQSEKRESQEKAGKKGLPGPGVLRRQAKVSIVKTIGSPVPENQRGGYEQKSGYSPEDVPEP
jgi:hypothetical protein